MSEVRQAGMTAGIGWDWDTNDELNGMGEGGTFLTWVPFESKSPSPLQTQTWGIV